MERFNLDAVEAFELLTRLSQQSNTKVADVAKALMQIAHEKNVGSIIIGHSRHGRLHELVRGSIVQKLLRLAGDVDVHVVADRGQGEH